MHFKIKYNNICKLQLKYLEFKHIWNNNVNYDKIMNAERGINYDFDMVDAGFLYDHIKISK